MALYVCIKGRGGRVVLIAGGTRGQEERKWLLCSAVAMNAEQVEGFSYSQPLLLHCTLFTKGGYRHGDRPRFVGFD